MGNIINVQTLVTAILVAVLTSLLSVHLALKKYRTEKWWEKKLECYIDTIHAMNEIINFCDGLIAEELDGEDIPKKRIENLRKGFHKGRLFLDTQLNIGHLLMSEEAHKELLLLDVAFNRAEKESDFMGKITEIRVKTEECIYSFIRHAKKDLGI